MSLAAVQIDGDPIIAQEVLAQIKLWDQAVIGCDAEALLSQCAQNVSMFDVSSHINGLNEYRAEWEKFSPYFMDGMQISRRDVKLITSESLAVLHCQSKVEHSALKGKLQMPWCRTTLCLEKTQGQWRVVHQHISMPVDMMTGKAIVLKDKPKLRLVV
ncbi:nuclear transport factor 2 family protein [Acinetobacter sp. 187]|uniref:nuclear transport factor 2 family protein n=1 Tax=Acinetobacter lanii TaxID=2715163 RepID=UPI0014090B2E|nr:nuclear transport factor 2 family protein [Acinetobacter lanii]NHC03452.1 nuclear transport factor 2 family protein [Acinetobacter lanii]